MSEMQLACIVAALVAKLPENRVKLTIDDMVGVGELSIEVDATNLTVQVSVVRSECH